MEDPAIWKTAAIDVESDPEEGHFHNTLLWRDDDLNELTHRCDASMSLIRKYEPVSAKPEPPGYN